MDIAPSGISPMNERALRRLALIGVAGELAVELGLLPRHANVREVVRRIAVNWLASIRKRDRNAQVISNIRSFILQKQAQFEQLSAPAALSGRVGWRDVQNDRWLFTVEQLLQAVQGTQLNDILLALRSRGFLFRNDPTRAKAKVHIGSLGKRIGVYAIQGSILGDDVINDKATGQPGQPGPEQAPQDTDPVTEAA